MRNIKSQLKSKHLYFISKSLVVILVAAIIIWSIILESNVTIHRKEPFQTLNSDWVQLIDGAEIPLLSAQDATVTSDSDTIIIEKTIPNLGYNRSVVFYTMHQEVSVSVDDEVLYELKCPEELETYSSPGRTWVAVSLDGDMVGKTLRLEFSSEFSFYQAVPDTIYFVNPNDIQAVQIDFMWIRNTVAFVILGLAIISYVNASIWKNSYLRKFLCTLADLYLFTGLWLCSEINVLSVWIGHSTLASFLAMIFIRIIPVVFYHFVCSTTSYKPIWVRIIGVLAWANLIVSIIAQFAFGISLVRTFPISILLLGVSSVVYLIGMLYQLIIRRYFSLNSIAYFATSILLLAALFEIHCYYNQNILGRYTGICISLSCVLYAVITHILLVRNEAKTAKDKELLEIKYNSLDIKPLNQQINAHFLFNSLNAISAYCKEDPVTADKSVNILAQYLRRYMALIDQSNYVPFKDEMVLIDLYLKMQNLRYEEDINLVVDFEFEDFVLPPLSLQPLIENAVSHGLHNYVDDGVINLTVKRFGEIIEIVISDNGKGFDPNSAAKNNGVGIKNLTRRVRTMGGDVKIESAPNRGTDAILRIPLILANDTDKENSR